MIIELLDQLAEAQSEREEQARLNGMGAERELALMSKLREAERRGAKLLARLEAAEAVCEAAGKFIRGADVWDDGLANLSLLLEEWKETSQ
jgi:hypothetical protein